MATLEVPCEEHLYSRAAATFSSRMNPIDETQCSGLGPREEAFVTSIRTGSTDFSRDSAQDSGGFSEGWLYKMAKITRHPHVRSQPSTWKTGVGFF